MWLVESNGGGGGGAADRLSLECGD